MVSCFINLRMFVEWVWLKLLYCINLFLRVDKRYFAWDMAVLGTTYEEWLHWRLICMELDRVQELESDRLLQEAQLDVSDFYKTRSLFKFICLKYEVSASLKMRIEAFMVE